MDKATNIIIISCSVLHLLGRMKIRKTFLKSCYESGCSNWIYFFQFAKTTYFLVVPPRIAPWPVEKFVEIGNIITLECKVRAIPRPSILWLKDNKAVPRSKYFGQFLRYISWLWLCVFVFVFSFATRLLKLTCE